MSVMHLVGVAQLVVDYVVLGPRSENGFNLDAF